MERQLSRLRSAWAYGFGRLLFFRVFARWFRIQIHREVLGGDARFNAVPRDFHFREPEDCVESEFSEVVVTPVAVKMGPGETESATSIWTLVCPGNGLRVSSLDCGAHGWITRV